MFETSPKICKYIQDHPQWYCNTLKTKFMFKKINMFLNVSSTWSNTIANYRFDIPIQNTGKLASNLIQKYWYYSFSAYFV